MIDDTIDKNNSNFEPSFTEQVEHLVGFTVSKMKPDGDMSLDDYMDILDTWKIIYSSHVDSIDIPFLAGDIPKSKDNFSEQEKFYSFVKKEFQEVETLFDVYNLISLRVFDEKKVASLINRTNVNAKLYDSIVEGYPSLEPLINKELEYLRK